MLDSKGFDFWATDYDKSVNISEANDDYPFAGYKKVLNYIYNQVRKLQCASILDIGFGTGVLTSQLYNDGYTVTGIDFSNSMIELAKKKMPKAALIKWDFKNGLPEDIKHRQFDFIISTYAIHHLTDMEKIEFIKSLCKILNDGGKILIGDVSFNTRKELTQVQEKYKVVWDNDEIYFVAEEIKEILNNDCYCSYLKLSHCAGVLTVVNRERLIK